MSTPIIWILMPIILSIIFWVILKNRRFIYLTGFVFSLMLTAAAIWLPIDQAIEFGSTDVKVSSVLIILGRQFILRQEQMPILAILYGIVAFWIFGAQFGKSPSILVPTSLLVTSFLVGSLAVSPFLYAAVFIELAVLITIPLFVQYSQNLNKGAIRLLIYQTIGMAFLLFTGWLLGGTDTAPASREAVQRILIFFGLGFAFILAIFPFYSWIPMLTEHDDIYSIGLLLILFPSAILLFVISFLDNYSWLRNSITLKQSLQVVGMIMVITGGLWSPFQKHLGRMFGYAVIVENGLSLLAISTLTGNGFHIFAGFYFARIISLGVWALGLAILQNQTGSLEINKVMGIGKTGSILMVGILTAQFSIGGLPILAGFPLRVALLDEISLQSNIVSVAMIIGLAGIWAAGFYSMNILFRSEKSWSNFLSPSIPVNILIIIGVLVIIFLGIFPQVYLPSMADIMLAYPHLH